MVTDREILAGLFAELRCTRAALYHATRGARQLHEHERQLLLERLMSFSHEVRAMMDVLDDGAQPVPVTVRIVRIPEVGSAGVVG